MSNTIGAPPPPGGPHRAPPDTTTRPGTTTTTTTTTGPAPGPAIDVKKAPTHAMALDAGAHKAVGNKSSSLVANVFQGLAGVAKFAVEHPMASIALAGAGTFIVGAFGLVSPFVGIMGGVVSVTTLMNSGGSQRADH